MSMLCPQRKSMFVLPQIANFVESQLHFDAILQCPFTRRVYTSSGRVFRVELHYPKFPCLLAAQIVAQRKSRTETVELETRQCNTMSRLLQGLLKIAGVLMLRGTEDSSMM